MDAKRSRRKNGNRLRITLLVLLLGLLTFANLARTQTDNQEIRVKIYTGQLGADGRSTPLSNVTVKVGPSTVTTDAAGETNAVVPRGKHNVKASRQGFVVSQMSNNPTGGLDRGYATPNSDEGDIEFSFLSRSFYEEEDKDYTLLVRLKPGTPQSKDEGEKDVKVILVSEECKSPPVWDGLDVRIGETKFDAGDMDEFASKEPGVEGQVRTKEEVKLRPGQQQIRISSADFPKIAILRAYVVRNYYSEKAKSWRSKIMLTYEPDDARPVTIDLAENLWEQRNGFRNLSLLLKVWGNCEDPKTDPEEFGIFKVIAVSGLVEAKLPLNSLAAMLDKKFAEEFNRSTEGARYEEGTTIRTGADGLIILESEYKHTITIDNSTEVKLSTLTTEFGRRQLRALVEKGKIKIERQSSGQTNDSEGVTTVQTKTATVNSTQTVYTVSYDETTKLTTVGVTEGEVEVFPANEALQPVTLRALQQVQVAENKVGPVTAFTPDGSASKKMKVLLYTVLGFLTLLLLFAMFHFIRKKQRLAWQPAHHPAWMRPGGTDTPPFNVSPPVPDHSSPRCPNPQCGKAALVGAERCAFCGTSLMRN